MHKNNPVAQPLLKEALIKISNDVDNANTDTKKLEIVLKMLRLDISLLKRKTDSDIQLDVQNAFRKNSIIFHPDKYVGRAEERSLSEKIFKLINNVVDTIKESESPRILLSKINSNVFLSETEDAFNEFLRRKGKPTPANPTPDPAPAPAPSSVHPLESAYYAAMNEKNWPLFKKIMNGGFDESLQKEFAPFTMKGHHRREHLTLAQQTGLWVIYVEYSKDNRDHFVNATNHVSEEDMIANLRFSVEFGFPHSVKYTLERIKGEFPQRYNDVINYVIKMVKSQRENNHGVDQFTDVADYLNEINSNQTPTAPSNNETQSAPNVSINFENIHKEMINIMETTIATLPTQGMLMQTMYFTNKLQNMKSTDTVDSLILCCNQVLQSVFLEDAFFLSMKNKLEHQFDRLKIVESEPSVPATMRPK